MNGKIFIINLLFTLLDIFLIVTGYFNFNVIFHGHIMNFFLGQSDGYLGLFWLVCLAHDLLIFNAILFAFHFLRKRPKRT